MTKEETILEIAKKYRLLRSQDDKQDLETYNSDYFDFYEVSVFGVKAALEAAYEAGWQACLDRLSDNYKAGIYPKMNPDSIVGDDGCCRTCKAKQPRNNNGQVERGVMGSWHNFGCEWRIFGVRDQ